MDVRYVEANGRRKTASARVRIVPGTGEIVVNNKPMEDFFGREASRKRVLAPLRATDRLHAVDVSVRVKGGGESGQAAATGHGIARALVKSEDEGSEAQQALQATLKSLGLLTRDARKKERKKPGLKRARKAPQYTKR